MPAITFIAIIIAPMFGVVLRAEAGMTSRRVR